MPEGQQAEADEGAAEPAPLDALVNKKGAGRSSDAVVADLVEI